MPGRSTRRAPGIALAIARPPEGRMSLLGQAVDDDGRHGDPPVVCFQAAAAEDRAEVARYPDRIVAAVERLGRVGADDAPRGPDRPGCR